MLDAARRLKENIAINDQGCWEWTASRDHNGYGRFNFGGKAWLAHRAAYHLLIGEIPENMCLDHRCRNPACVNPLHVDPITRKANTLKGISFSATNARKRHCIHGHPFDEANTYTQGGKRRQCRKCNLQAVNSYKERLKTDPLELACDPVIEQIARAA